MSDNTFKLIKPKVAVMLVLVLLAFYVFIPQFGSFKDSFATLLDGDFVLVAISGLFWMGSVFVAAVVYQLITLKRLKYSKTLLVQFAGGLTNRLLPAGAGGLALNVRYLSKSRHTTLEASALVALNNIMGFLGNLLLVVVALVFSSEALPDNLNPSRAQFIIIIGIAAVCLAALFTVGKHFENKLKMTIRTMVKHALGRPISFVTALLASTGLTICYVLALYSMCLAFNVHITLFQTLFVMTVGVAAGTVTPTPGGLGGAEAGLVASLIAVGAVPHQALTVALTYRFVTYWLPILPGIVCFETALRKKYI